MRTFSSDGTSLTSLTSFTVTGPTLGPGSGWYLVVLPSMTTADQLLRATSVWLCEALML